jgi:hypothetical protein
MTLHEFLDQSHQFRWGGIAGDDCMTFCARWIGVAKGEDPIKHIRGMYSDAEGADRLIARSGGLVALASNMLEVHGYQRTYSPVDGDVGIVRSMAGFEVDGVSVKEIGAIRFGPLWAVIGQHGVRARKAEFVAAWSIGA